MTSIKHAAAALAGALIAGAAVSPVWAAGLEAALRTLDAEDLLPVSD